MRNKINIIKLNILAGIFFVFAVSVSSLYAQVKLVPQRINLKNSKTFNLNLPADYEIIPAAEGIETRSIFRQSARRTNFRDRYVQPDR